MGNLIQRLKEDKEIQDLKKKCYELTGKNVPYHWDCFKDFEDYKEHMRRIIKKYDAAGR